MQNLETKKKLKTYLKNIITGRYYKELSPKKNLEIKYKKISLDKICLVF